MKNEKGLLGFILTFLSSILWPSLPQISLIAFVIIALILTLLYRFSAVAVGILVGFLWATLCGYYYTSWQIDETFFKHNVIVEGEVLSLQAPPPLFKDLKDSQSKHMRVNLPQQGIPEQTIKFNFAISKIGQYTQPLRPYVRLSWYAPSMPIQQGDTLKLLLSLKPPVGLANPHGFNYQKWLVSKNISALGYVKTSPSNRFIKKNPSIRQTSVNELLAHNLPNLRWILALSYGDRRLLNKDDWDLMQRTGTSHLFAISGMHLGIVFGFTLMISRAMFYTNMLLPNTAININVKPWLLIFPMGICIAYSFLAGFEIPVLRALCTLLVWTFLSFLCRYWRARSMLLVLLSSFFIMFPFSILGISFWLSFIVVAVIMLFLWRFKMPQNASVVDKIIHILKLQLFISIVTLPLIAHTFSSLPILSFVANMFMIPVVTFVLVPLCLIAAVIAAVGFDTHGLYWFIDICFERIFLVLHFIDRETSSFLGEHLQGDAWVTKGIKWLTHPVAISMMLLVVLPSWPNKKRLLLGISGLFLAHMSLQYQHAKVDKKSYLYAMDVGQGSAIVLTNNQGVMLYDTGGSFAGFSMANSVLMPFFKAHGIKALDYLVLSHLDNDHAGGAALIRHELNVRQNLAPKNKCNVQDFEKQYPLGNAQYLGFEVLVLWPLLPMSGEENDHSCVMRLQKGGVSILLTGDIEKQSESAMLRRYKYSNVLRSTIMFAPHHGSGTSSSLEFIKAVAPDYVVFTSGHNNRWGFPLQKVVNRYEHMNTHVLITGKQGRIRFAITPNNVEVSTYRDDEYARWYFKAQ